MQHCTHVGPLLPLLEWQSTFAFRLSSSELWCCCCLQYWGRLLVTVIQVCCHAIN